MGIFYEAEAKTFYLESKDISYVFKIHELGFLQHLYFGKRIGRDNLDHTFFLKSRGQECVLPFTEGRKHSLNQYFTECPSVGRSDFKESMLAVSDERGSRISSLVYVSHKVYNVKPQIDGMPSIRRGKTLAVKLKDECNDSVVILYYTVFDDVPAIARRMEIINKGKNPLIIDRAYSASVELKDNNWEAITLYGAHERERQIDRTPIFHGVTSVDSKVGSASSGQLNPFMALVRPNTVEEEGEAIGFNLIYSGSFVIKAQSHETDTLRILGGINDYDFEWTLRRGEKFSTPEAVLVYSDGGLGKMSRAFHDLYREYLINPNYVKKSRPVVINNWEATYFKFDNEKLCAIIDSVKGSGIDTFVLDDGWFGVRNDDLSGLGDWVVNTDKLKGGLNTVIDYAHKSGLKFGLWFEPEMVNKDSDLYRAHPDWIIHVPGIEPCPGRDQQILDLSRKEVCDYIIDAVSTVLKNHDIDYVKWDMNRTMTENYSVALGKKSKELHVRYMLGLYRICEELVNGFPEIFFEGCASGGCRFDPAMMYYFPQIWTSDDSDAFFRTRIQYGTSLCYPLSTMSCHVSECPNHQTGRVTPLKARADIAHLGATGYELDTTKMKTEEIAQINAQVEEYKKMEDLVLCGDLYRLSSPFDTNLFAEEIVAKDKSRAHITTMRIISMPNRNTVRVYPKGLDENATYTVAGTDIKVKGSTLMNAGLVCTYEKMDFATCTFELIRE